MLDAAAVAAIIPAAGTGTRLGAEVPKAFVEVDGLSLVARSALSLSGVAGVIIVAVPDGYLPQAAAHLSVVDAEVHVVVGGDTRQASVAAALAIVPEHIAYVLVHDAARAFVPREVSQRVLARLEDGAAAVIPVLPVVDTVRQVGGDVAGAVIDRDTLARVQTPQGFAREVLVDAYARASAIATDDAALVAAHGAVVHTVAGSERAFKVTTQEDLAIARAYAGGPA